MPAPMCATDRPEKGVAGTPRRGARGVDLTHVQLGCRVGAEAARESVAAAAGPGPSQTAWPPQLRLSHDRVPRPIRAVRRDCA
jgi:hypothetical protein